MSDHVNIRIVCKTHKPLIRKIRKWKLEYWFQFLSFVWFCWQCVGVTVQVHQKDTKAQYTTITHQDKWIEIRTPARVWGWICCYFSNIWNSFHSNLQNVWQPNWGDIKLKACRIASLTTLINRACFQPNFLSLIKSLNSAEGPRCISPSRYVLNIWWLWRGCIVKHRGSRLNL